MSVCHCWCWLSFDFIIEKDWYHLATLRQKYKRSILYISIENYWAEYDFRVALYHQDLIDTWQYQGCWWEVRRRKKRTGDIIQKKEGKKRENVLLHVGEVGEEKTKWATGPDQLKAIKHEVEGANSGSPALWGLFRCLVYQVVSCFKAVLTITMLKLVLGWLQIESRLGVAEDEGGGG